MLYLNQKRTMWVKDYMKDCFNVITGEKTLAEAVKQMVRQKVNSLVVVDPDSRPVGLVTSHVLIKEVVPEYLKGDPTHSQFGAEGTLDRYAQKSKDKQVSDFMYKEFHALSDKDAMIEAASYLVEGDRRTLPVVDGEGKLVGVITRTCVKKALFNSLFPEERIDPKEDCDCPKHSV